MDTLKINYFNQYCCISLPYVNKEYENLSYEVYSDKGYSCVCNLKNYKNSDNKLHVTFSYNRDECYFLKIILNDKIITTFIKPNNTLGRYRHDNSNIRMNINRDGIYNKDLSRDEFIKNIDTLKTDVETKLLEEEAPSMDFMELRRQLYNLNKLGGFKSKEQLFSCYVLDDFHKKLLDSVVKFEAPLKVEKSKQHFFKIYQLEKPNYHSMLHKFAHLTGIGTHQRNANGLNLVPIDRGDYGPSTRFRFLDGGRRMHNCPQPHMCDRCLL